MTPAPRPTRPRKPFHCASPYCHASRFPPPPPRNRGGSARALRAPNNPRGTRWGSSCASGCSTRSRTATRSSGSRSSSACQVRRALPRPRALSWCFVLLSCLHGSLRCSRDACASSLRQSTSSTSGTRTSRPSPTSEARATRPTSRATCRSRPPAPPPAPSPALTSAPRFQESVRRGMKT